MDSTASMSQIRVLCVSGDPATRADVERSLSATGLSVAPVRSRTGALAKLQHGNVDAVVIDAANVDDVTRLLEAVSESEEVVGIVYRPQDGEALVTATEPATSEGGRRVRRQLLATLGRGESAGALQPAVDGIRRRLADATSPGSIERAVREELTATASISFAWIGEYDRGEQGVVPWVTEPAVEWPVNRSFQIGDGSEPMLEAAIETESLQLANPADDPAAVPLGDVAVERDVRTVAVAPLASDEELYGVLVVYAATTIGASERELIESITATTSTALEGIALRGRVSQQAQTLERYERLVETAGDGMYVLDAEGHFTTVNDALVAMTGYSREGLLGEHASIVFGADGADQGAKTIERVLRTEESTGTVELALVCKDGTEIPCETKLAVLGDDEFRGSVGVVRDVTERIRRERRLRQQNDRLDAFASIVSHDLRNPLSVAKGYAEIIDSGDSPEELEAITESLDRMESIITDVLTIARDGTWVDETEIQDLDSVARAAWENVSTDAATLSVDATATIDVDRSPMLRLLENLYRNAIEHGGKDVTVRIGTLSDRSLDDRPGRSVDDQAGETATSAGQNTDSSTLEGFFVEDDGEGMAPAIREKAFDAEFTSESAGLGIGLWVVREVATGHGWTVSVGESERGGARFEFRFDD